MKVKAKDLRDGDTVLLDDGTTAKVVRNKQVKVTIPKRKVTKHNIVVEASRRKSGVATKRTDIMVAWDNSEFEIEDRTDLTSRITRFKDTYHGYINAFAAAATGSAITVACVYSGVVTHTVGSVMLAATLVLTSALTWYEYKKE